jgi:hypothetical protein
MSLSNPDARRGLRAIVQAVLALALIGLLYWITSKVAGGSPVIMTIARGGLIILGLGEIFYGAENVTRAIKLTGIGGTSLEFGADPAPVKVVNPPEEPIPVEAQEPQP